jgi:hypothetical protein
LHVYTFNFVYVAAAQKVSTSAQNCGANLILGGGNVRSEESVGIENDGTQRNENVEM